MTPPGLLTKFAVRAKARWHTFQETRRGRRILKGLRYLLTVVIVGYLGYRMTTIGWGEIWASLPRTPWFYILFGAIYLTLPIFQTIIYGLIFRTSPWTIFPAALKKRVYNKDVMSYSGEVYLYFWARDRIDMPALNILHGIKDNTIVSSITATVVAFSLLATFFFSGLVVLPEMLVEHNMAYAAVVVLVIGGMIALGIRFRRSILKLSGAMLLTLFALHTARLLLIQSLQVTQWVVVAPEIPLQAWFTFLAVQIIAESIPFVPSRDLVGVGFAIEVARATQVPEALIASLMLVHSVMDKALNLLLFMAVSAWDRKNMARQSLPQEMPSEAALKEKEPNPPAPHESS
ncbi:hypothetical protein CRI93_03195 [Longimonas halophila]|uniref:Flippase-like domain-containing protein n=1 Tax=Longimonas halophila TaxID=1469170 RepID=A0A2H3NVQ0_9BACT|nr:hypothetical protein [Longimonas halophila]PEN08777.1 hypothetical protein CRI93_03195 [Longimonas halophila]